MDRIIILKLVIIALLAVSLAGNVFLGFTLLSVKKEILKVQQHQTLNTRILHFADLFVSKVLRAEGEISFEERLKIENAVRETQDQEILSQWEKFVGAQTELEAREEIKNLLQLIVNKISL